MCVWGGGAPCIERSVCYHKEERDAQYTYMHTAAYIVLMVSADHSNKTKFATGFCVLCMCVKTVSRVVSHISG